MRLQILASLIFISFVTFGQESQILKAKLVDFSSNKIPAYCGIFAWATTLKFEIISQNENFKKGEQILIVFCCPREMGDTMFVNKQNYLITTYGISKQDKEITDYGWTIFYKYEKEKLPRLWCKEFKKLE